MRNVQSLNKNEGSGSGFLCDATVMAVILRRYQHSKADGMEINTTTLTGISVEELGLEDSACLIES